MSTTTENPFLNPKKKKKHLWGLWIPLIIIGAIVIIPAGLVMLLFFDPAHYDTGVTETIKPEQLFTDLTNNLFDNCRSSADPSIDLVITEENLNKLLLGTAQDINTNQIQNNPGMPEFVKTNIKIEQLDIQINDKDYLFEMEASAFNFFKTRAQIVMHVTQNAPLSDGTEGFIFDITNVKVGRVGGILDLISTFGVDIGGLLTSIDGINWKYNAQKTRLEYSNTQFQQDILAKANLGSGIFTDLFKTFFDQELINFPHTAHQIKGTIPLANFRKHNDFYSEALSLSAAQQTILNNAADNVQTLLRNNVLTETMAKNRNLTIEKAAHAAHKYLALGLPYLENYNENSLIQDLYGTAAFKEMIGNKTLEEYSTLAKNTYFGTVDTTFIEKVKGDAQAKVTNLLENSKDTEIGGVDLTGLTYEEIIQKIKDSEAELKEKSKTMALYDGIKGKIKGADKAWYLFSKDQTTYYYDNSSTKWDRVYAYAYNSDGSEADMPGISMTYVGDDIWSYNVSPEYTNIKFGHGSTYVDLKLDAEKRYYDGTKWSAVPTSIKEDANSIKLTDSIIHNYVKDNAGIVGYGFPFVSKDATGNYKYSYTMVDSVYPVTNIVDGKTYFSLIFGLNINGTSTQLILPCESIDYTPTQQYTFGLRFSIENATMYYGNIEVPKVKDTLKDIMKGAALQTDFFSIDSGATTMTFKIDLKDLVTKGDFKTLHDHLTSDDPGDEFACNAELFLNIVPTVNDQKDQATKGVGGFYIEVGYKAKA